MRFMLAGLAWLCVAAPVAAQTGPLTVHADGRHLVRADGTPFFWLGDTAWELFHRLTREEAERYLDNRRATGFTVIQAVGLAEFEGLTRPNAYGHLPLLDSDPARPAVKDGPGNDYWDHVEDAHIRVLRGEGFVFVYLPLGQTVTLTLSPFNGRKLIGWWFDPRTGNSRGIGELESTADLTLDAPGEPAPGNDWVLVLDERDHDWAAPGR